MEKLKNSLSKENNNTHPNIIKPGDWLNNKTKSNEQKEPLLRAVLCLEHLIKQYYSQTTSPKILEVGPAMVDSITLFNGNKIKVPEAKQHIAPISLLQKRNPTFKCAAIGPQQLSNRQKTSLLGDAKYIQGLLLPEDGSSDLLLKIEEQLEGAPDIIYGQHVFENSSAATENLPFGPYKIFEKAAQILSPKGFIVVDNYSGDKRDVGILDYWPYSQKMKQMHSYMYGKDKGIYVFQKEE
ncbi:MAG: hypothetical protein PHT51_04370 [Patescibacteria group bacterium]|nr:hypothetical protein [Patescibacteria group bacterium]MDD4610697.1 hypothetical protein [Patescibacteria group bacterium]